MRHRISDYFWQTSHAHRELFSRPSLNQCLRLKFTKKASKFVDGDLAESMKRSASDRLGDSVPEVLTSEPGLFSGILQRQ